MDARYSRIAQKVFTTIKEIGQDKNLKKKMNINIKKLQFVKT